MSPRNTYQEVREVRNRILAVVRPSNLKHIPHDVVTQLNNEWIRLNMVIIDILESDKSARVRHITYGKKTDVAL